MASDKPLTCLDCVNCGHHKSSHDEFDVCHVLPCHCVSYKAPPLPPTRRDTTGDQPDVYLDSIHVGRRTPDDPNRGCWPEDAGEVTTTVQATALPTCDGLGLCVKRGLGPPDAQFCNGAGRCIKGLATADACPENGHAKTTCETCGAPPGTSCADHKLRPASGLPEPSSDEEVVRGVLQRYGLHHATPGLYTELVGLLHHVRVSASALPLAEVDARLTEFENLTAERDMWRARATGSASLREAVRNREAEALASMAEADELRAVMRNLVAWAEMDSEASDPATDIYALIAQAKALDAEATPCASPDSRGVERGVAQSGSEGGMSPSQDRPEAKRTPEAAEHRTASPMVSGSSPDPSLDSTRAGDSSSKAVHEFGCVDPTSAEGHLRSVLWELLGGRGAESVESAAQRVKNERDNALAELTLYKSSDTKSAAKEDP